MTAWDHEEERLYVVMRFGYRYPCEYIIPKAFGQCSNQSY